MPNDIDLSKVQWDETPQIDESKVQWDETPAAGTKEPQSWGDWLAAQKPVVASAVAGAGEAIPLAKDAASALKTGASYLWGNELRGTAGERFAQAKREQERAGEIAGEQHPYAKGAGMAAGIVGTLPSYELAAPAEAALAAKIAPKVGQTLADVTAMGATGAGLGAVQGLGEGVSLEDRLGNAARGAGMGAGLGAAVPAVGKVVGYGAKKGKEALEESFPGLVSGAEKSAEKKIGETVQRDIARGHEVLTPEEIEAARKRGQDVLPIDIGGSELHGEARRVSNASPEAEATLSGTLRERYADQQQRYTDYLKRLAGNDKLDAATTVEKMRDAARKVNAPAYKAAYEAGAGGVWTPELYNLTNTPSVKKAIPEAIEKLQTRSVLEGTGPIQNPFVKDEAGNYFLREGFKPNLEFWDSVKRSLDDKITALDRKGKYDKSRDIKAVRKQLLDKLDTAVPEFKKARAGAAEAFGEDNAFDAGMNFLSKQNTLAVSEAKKAFSRMGDEEKEIFANGVLHDLTQKIKNKDESRDISKMFNSPEMREKLSLALGPERAAELEAFTRIEGLMARSHQAIQSNSTTARQLSRMGALGAGLKKGVTSTVLPAMGFATHGPMGIAAGAAAQAAISHLADTLGQAQARVIAQKLVSKNPEDIQQAVKIIAKSPKSMAKLRNVSKSLALLGTSKGSSAERMVAKDDEDRTERASGGKVGSRDYPAKRLTRIERALKRAQDALALETKAVMQHPDETVAHALRIAEKK